MEYGHLSVRMEAAADRNTMWDYSAPHGRTDSTVHYGHIANYREVTSFQPFFKFS